MISMDRTRVTRKSCDFCYRRKLKCDSAKPKCSSCVAYAAECTFGIPSRPYTRKGRSQFVGNGNTSEDLHNRVENLEFQLRQLESHSSASGKSNLPLLCRTLNTRRPPEYATTSIDESLDSTAENRDLPPFEQTLALAQRFLAEFNSCLPLFDPKTLLRLVIETYDCGPESCDIRAWAAIHVVLGLTHSHSLRSNFSCENVALHLGKAQSVLSKLVLQEASLLTVQILLGIIMLLRAQKDQQPAQILIATTMRLVHKLRLHDRFSSEHLGFAAAKERSNVFWLAYILDKDISMLSKLPSFQLDDDIDLELPDTQNDASRNVSLMQFNDEGQSDSYAIKVTNQVVNTYFRTRVNLAVLQGAVYDYLYSTRAQKRSAPERVHALTSVAKAFSEWKATVPLEFRNVEAFEKLPNHIVAFLSILHCTTFLCTTLVYQAHAWNSGWLTSLQRYGSEGIEPTLPPHWEALVGEARDMVMMSNHLEVRGDRTNFWTMICASSSAIVLLIANNMRKPDNEIWTVDAGLIDTGLMRVRNTLVDFENEDVRKLVQTCTELHQYAKYKRVEVFSARSFRETL